MSKHIKKNKSELIGSNRMLVGLLLAVLLFVPLALKFVQINYTSPIMYDNAVFTSGIKVNVFTYLKSILLLIGGIIGVFLIFTRMTLGNFVFKDKVIYISLAVAVLGLVISAIASPYKTIALYGDYMRQEGTLTNLLYLFFFFVAMTVTYSQRQIKWIGYILYPFVIINSLLTTLHFFGYNTLGNEFVQKLIGLDGSVTINKGSSLIATLDNINYISGVSAVLVGLYLTWAILEEKMKPKIVNLLVALLAMLILFGSTSQSGFFTFIVVFILIIGLLFFAKNIKQAVLTMLVFLVASSALFVPLAKYNENVWNETIGIFNIPNPFSNNKTLADNTSSSVVYNPNKLFGIELPKPGQSAGSGRTYIWEKTIELIEERPLFGYGMDTFAYSFPQDDPNKISGLGSSEIIVDKPHNLYLSYGYGAGLLTLLAILVLVGTGLVRTGLLIVRRKFDPSEDSIVIAFFIASIAFFVQGLFNDSIVGVAPIAWILFGVVISKVLNKTT